MSVNLGIFLVYNSYNRIEPKFVKLKSVQLSLVKSGFLIQLASARLQSLILNSMSHDEYPTQKFSLILTLPLSLNISISEPEKEGVYPRCLLVQADHVYWNQRRTQLHSHLHKACGFLNKLCSDSRVLLLFSGSSVSVTIFRLGFRIQ